MVVKPDLNHHLSRVMKLIKTREDVSKNESPDLIIAPMRQKTGLEVETGPSSFRDKNELSKNLKRSLTSLSQEQLLTQSGSKNKQKNAQSKRQKSQMWTNRAVE